MGKKAYIALGSNMGNSAENVKNAYEALDLVPGVKTVKLSELYITKPWGYEQQADFTNACCEVETELTPEALLGVCLGIEAGMGRVRAIKNGPRVIDLDLLAYEGETRNTEELVLPHPGMLVRSFVLLPLKDLTCNGYILDYNIYNALEEIGAKN